MNQLRCQFLRKECNSWANCVARITERTVFKVSTRFQEYSIFSKKFESVMPGTVLFPIPLGRILYRQMPLRDKNRAGQEVFRAEQRRRTNKHDSPYNLVFLRTTVHPPEPLCPPNLSGEMALCTQAMPLGTVIPSKDVE